MRRGRRIWGVAVAAALIPLAQLYSAPAYGTAANTLLGVYYGNQGWAMNDVRALESWQAKRDAVLNLYANWDTNPHTVDNVFNQQLPNVWNNGNVPMVTWQPYVNGTTPSNIEVQIANGAYDSYISTWASRMRGFLAGPDGAYGGTSTDDRRVYLRLAHEMNGNWYPWTAAVGANSPSDYVRMWRHVRDLFNRAGLDSNHIRWVWAVNYVDVGGFSAEQFFPGTDAVDWVAVDGYNWGASQSWSSWATPSQVFGNMVGRLAQYAKPLSISEVASTTSTTSGTSVAAKSQWVSDFFAYATNTANARMVAWFNADKETDWAVFGGANGDGTFRYGNTTYRTYAAYKAAVQPLASSTGSGRLLTDAQFAGT